MSEKINFAYSFPTNFLQQQQKKKKKKNKFTKNKVKKFLNYLLYQWGFSLFAKK